MALSCETNRVMIYDRGGVNRLGELSDVSRVQWTRVRDDTSECSVTLAMPGKECARVIADSEPGRHEVVIFRGEDRVWEGPMTLKVEAGSYVELGARDITHYMNRMIMRSEYDNSWPNIDSFLNRFQDIFDTELARFEALDPPLNVLPHIRYLHSEGEARTSRQTDAYQMYVFDHLDDSAVTGGIDYTVIGRSLMLFDTHALIGQTPVVGEADFTSELRVTSYGLEMATYAAVNNGQGDYATAGGEDSFYGLWEILDSAYDEENSETPTHAEMRSQAQRNLAGRLPTPVTLNVPANSRITPTSRLTIADLVPGVLVPVRLELPTRTFNQNQKIDRLTVTETANGGEVIAVTMSPAPGALADVIPE